MNSTFDAKSVGPGDSREPSAPGDGLQRQLLDELQLALTSQLSLAERDDLEGVQALTDEVDALLERLTSLAGADEHIDRARLERIRRLHSTLRLSLAAQKEQLGGRLSHARRGKNALRAYGGKAGA